MQFALTAHQKADILTKGLTEHAYIYICEWKVSVCLDACVKTLHPWPLQCLIQRSHLLT